MIKLVKLTIQTIIWLLLPSLACLAQSEEQKCSWQELPNLLQDEKGKPIILKSRELEKRLIWGEEPKYPRSCRCQGAVNVFLHIDTKGEVVCFQVLSGHPLFKASISAVIKSWRFTPYQTDEGIKSFAAILTYNFSLDTPSRNFDTLKTLPCKQPTKVVVSNAAGQITWLNPDEMIARAIELPTSLHDAHFKGRGYVLVNVLVDEKGRVTCAAPVNGHPILRALAMSSFTRWKFRPLLVNNKPLPFFGHVLLSNLKSNQ